MKIFGFRIESEEPIISDLLEEIERINKKSIENLKIPKRLGISKYSFDIKYVKDNGKHYLVFMYPILNRIIKWATKNNIKKFLNECGVNFKISHLNEQEATRLYNEKK